MYEKNSFFLPSVYHYKFNGGSKFYIKQMHIKIFCSPTLPHVDEQERTTNRAKEIERGGFVVYGLRTWSLPAGSGSTTKVGISSMSPSGFPECSTRVKPPMASPPGCACIRLYQ